MALSTYSAFYYGLKIGLDNNIINFDEGSGELSAEISIGTYDYAGLMVAVKDAMDAVGINVYTVSVNRTTRIITIAANNNFDLPLSTGSGLVTSPFDLLGFNQAADLTGAATYSGDTASGFEYMPQFPLQDYQDPETFKDRIDPSVNVSASGDVEIISYGLVRFVEFSLKWITDISQDGIAIRNNPSGVQAAVDFLTSITERGKFEFMPDISARSTFNVLVLDSLQGFSNGTGFKLKELVNKNLPGYYEVNDLKSRVIE